MEQIDEDVFLSLLANDVTGTYNKQLAKNIGAMAAIVYGDLVRKYKYYKTRGMLDKDGMFFSTINDLSDSVGLSRHEQDTAIANLIQAGLLIKKTKGVPPKRHFKLVLDISVLNSILSPMRDNTDDCKRKESKMPENNQFAETRQINLSESDTPICRNPTRKSAAIRQYNNPNIITLNEIPLTTSKQEYTEEQQIVVDRLAFYKIVSIPAWLIRIIEANDFKRINRNIDYVVNVEKPDKVQIPGAIINAIREDRAGAAAAAKERRDAREMKLHEERTAQTYAQAKETSLSAFEAHAVICQQRGLSFLERAFESGMEKIKTLGLTDEAVRRIANDYTEHNDQKHA